MGILSLIFYENVEYWCYGMYATVIIVKINDNI